MNTTAVVQEDGLLKLDTPQPPRKRRFSLGTLGSYAILLVLAAAYLGPLAMLVNTSFMTQREFNRNATALPATIQLENYAEAWERANFTQYLANTVLYAATATAVYVITAVFLAFPIARGYIRGGNAIFLLFVIALFLPPALIPQFQLILNLGLYNTRTGYIMLLVTNPVGIIILVNYLKSLPRELDEAAAMDGCGYLRFLMTIVFPLARPVIATVIVLHAIGIWNELILATIYLTNQDFYPITRGMIVFQGVYGFNWPVLAAGVVLMAIPMVILFLILQRYIISGLTQGAVKE
ncbi:MAG: carbohydrate ABC transporter permease [Chloroflexi bacterium]|nr:carbohydrate ABC transporter permease [Chloroflexota bacterium]